MLKLTCPLWQDPQKEPTIELQVQTFLKLFSSPSFKTNSKGSATENSGSATDRTDLINWHKSELIAEKLLHKSGANEEMKDKQ